MQKIGPCLWFNDEAEEAANFYVSVFRNSRILGITRYPEGLSKPAGSVLTVSFVLDGEAFVALNGGAQYAFTPAISFVVKCDMQKELDCYWQKLTEGGVAGPCGWLTDRYGVSWQIVPQALLDMLSWNDAAASQRAVAAMLGMSKLDIATLQRAYKNEGETP